MSENMGKIGEMTYDGFISDVRPAVCVGAGTIAGGEADTAYKRGTILARAEDGKLHILGSEGEADCILCDDITVKAGEDVTVPVYIAGCFNTNKITVADGYTITDTDKDNLRKRGIVFKAALNY